MSLSERQQRWQTCKTLTPEKRAAARLALEQIRAGMEVMCALRSHPLADGGVLSKSALVAAYHELLAATSADLLNTPPSASG